MELRSTNNDVVEKQNNGDCSLKDSEPFRKHYAMVLVQLKEASGQACGFHEFHLVLDLYINCTILCIDIEANLIIVLTCRFLLLCLI